MLKSLTIKNYVLIDHLELDFSEGFTVLTGETGAGKSILLGALGLVLGQRADMNAVSDKDEKCFVEGVFDISKLELNKFFDQNDLEYESEIVIRRVLFPNGKSRAFINEMPVNLNVLKLLSQVLIDIHSQHQNLLIKDAKFQLGIIDSFADNAAAFVGYREKFMVYREQKNIYKNLVEEYEKEKLNLDFYTHQLEKFEVLDLENLSIESLDQELELMQNGADIQQGFVAVNELIDGENGGVVGVLEDILSNLSSLKKYLPACEKLEERVNSVLIEVTDINDEANGLAANIEIDPQRLEFLQSQMSVLYQLFETFRVQKSSELLEKKQDLEEKIENIVDFEGQIGGLEKMLAEQEVELKNLAQDITEKRQAVFPKVEKLVVEILQDMGMPHALFIVQHKISSKLTVDGQDEIVFLFTANLGQVPQEVAASASGGEIARIMFALKSLISEFSGLPTIIFDEIDTGISGKIAEKMGHLMDEMGGSRQILTITHLPQIAARGHNHLLVEKDHLEGKTTTNIRGIVDEERIAEVAQMLSGADVGANALEHARGMVGIS